MITDLMTDKQPLTKTKAEFVAEKTVEYKKLWEYHKEKENIVAALQSVYMWHAFSYFDVKDPERKQWHFDNATDFALLQVCSMMAAYL